MPARTELEPKTERMTAKKFFSNHARKLVERRLGALHREEEIFTNLANTIPQTLGQQENPTTVSDTQQRLHADAQRVRHEIERLPSFTERLVQLLDAYGLGDEIIFPIEKTEAEKVSSQPSNPDQEIPDWVKEALEDQGPPMFEGKIIAAGRRMHPNARTFKILKILTNASGEPERKASKSIFLRVFFHEVPSKKAMASLSLDIHYLKEKVEKDGLTIVNPALGSREESYYKLIRKSPKPNQPVAPGQNVSETPVEAAIFSSSPIATVLEPSTNGPGADCSVITEEQEEKEVVDDLSSEEKFMLACVADSKIGQLILLKETGRLFSPEVRGRIKEIKERISREALPPSEQGEQDDLLLNISVKLSSSTPRVGEQMDDGDFLLSLFSGITRSPDDVFSEIVEKMSKPPEKMVQMNDDDILALAILLRAPKSRPVLNLKKYDIKLNDLDIRKINEIADPISEQRKRMKTKDLDKEVIPEFVEKMLRLPRDRQKFLDNCSNKVRFLFNFFRGLDGERFGSLMLELYEAHLSGSDLEESVERVLFFHGKNALPFNAPRLAAMTDLVSPREE